MKIITETRVFDLSAACSETAKGNNEFWPDFVGKYADELKQMLEDGEGLGDIFNDNGGLPDGPSWLVNLAGLTEEAIETIKHFGFKIEDAILIEYDSDNPPSGRWTGWSSNDEALVIKK